MTSSPLERAYQRRVLHYYNRFARMYDLGEFIRARTRNKVIEMSGWQPGETVLDVCAGTGTLTIAFARRGAHVTGVDLARGMLERASVKSNGRLIRWLQMDATQLGFADKSFDVSVLSLALHHMPEAEQVDVLKELRRVTRRRIVLLEPEVPVKPNWFRAWAFVASLIDESEYMREWVRQDFIGTCEEAGLRVEQVKTSRFWIHRFVLCEPKT